jgi:hypothetical protein
VDSSLRYFGCAVGFGFGVVWMTVGLGAAIVSLLLAALGYGAVVVAGRAQADGIARHSRVETLEAKARELAEIDLDREPYFEPTDDATSPLAAEAEYGWPLAKPEVAQSR